MGLTGIPWFVWVFGLSSLVRVAKIYRQVSPKSLRAIFEPTALAVLLLIKKEQTAQHVQGEP